MSSLKAVTTDCAFDNIDLEREVLFQMLNAANRDPAYFTNPDQFDIRRENNKHIAFGMGIHFCVAASLARTEAALAVGTSLKRFSNLALRDSRPSWDVGKRNSRVLKTLPVSL